MIVKERLVLVVEERKLVVEDEGGFRRAGDVGTKS